MMLRAQTMKTTRVLLRSGFFLIVLTGRAQSQSRDSAAELKSSSHAHGAKLIRANRASKESSTTLQEIDLFKGMSQGLLAVEAEGRGNGQMTLSVRNNST